MYQVFFNDYPLHDLRDERLILREPEVNLAVGQAGDMSFTIDPGHPYADQLTRLKGTVKLLAGATPIFKGRIRKDTRDFNLSRQIEVEGLLACLNDSIIPPFSFPDDFQENTDYQTAADSGNVVEFFLGWLLNQHNAQVGPEQQIQLGTVTVADPNNYISRASSDYLTTMEVVRQKLADLLGGYLLADYSGETTKLHYYADLPLTNVQPVEFGKNLLDLVSVLDSVGTYTAIQPIGAEGLTIGALPDGEISPGIFKAGLIIYSQEAENAINGRIIRKEEWKDVTQDENLQTKAAARLTGEGGKADQTFSVTALDLGVVEDLPRFTVGRYVNLTSTPHGFAAAYPLTELKPDILNPANTKITMGATVKTASDISHSTQSANQEKQDQFRLDLNKQQNQLTELTESVRTQITQAIQTSEQILLSALDSYAQTSSLETLRQTMEAQFSVMAEEISLRFTETVEKVTNVNGDLQQTIETLEKHFDFRQDGLTIRAGENVMNLQLDNDLIRFVKNGQTFGWWDGVDFHTGNIVVDLNERFQIGNFAAIPRSSGSVSWLKVKG